MFFQNLNNIRKLIIDKFHSSSIQPIFSIAIMALQSKPIQFNLKHSWFSKSFKTLLNILSNDSKLTFNSSPNLQSNFAKFSSFSKQSYLSIISSQIDRKS